jgi:hypothetical protein
MFFERRTQEKKGAEKLVKATEKALLKRLQIVQLMWQKKFKTYLYNNE